MTFSLSLPSSPIHDLKQLLSPLGVQFFDKSLSSACSKTNTCYSPLRLLTRKNAMNPSRDLAERFYRFYRDQPEMNLVDMILCFHPASMCELYMPFNRSLIIIASTRYELARFTSEQWQQWNRNLKIISQDPKHLIAANNRYDAEYIRYFTGINVTILPSFCQYTNNDYNPIKTEFLLTPIHRKSFERIFLESLDQSLVTHPFFNLKILPLRTLYPNYDYSDLTHHPAIIHIPYQVSIMSLFEQYRMNIPLVFPSLDLLTQWHYDYQVVIERTWDGTLYGQHRNHSRIQGVQTDIPDPNNELDRHAIRYWLNFSDFYQWPHIIYFDSVDDLLDKLLSTNFSRISEQMKIYNRQLAKTLRGQWRNILENVKRYSKKRFPND